MNSERKREVQRGRREFREEEGSSERKGEVRKGKASFDRKGWTSERKGWTSVSTTFLQM